MDVVVGEDSDDCVVVDGVDVVVGEDSVDCCVVILFDSGGCKVVG